MTTDKVSDHMTKMYDEAMALADLEPAAFITERLDGTKRSVMLIEKYDPRKPEFWANEEARAQHRVIPLYAARSAPEAGKAVDEIVAERQRQISAEGWTPEHDDEHDKGEMARAAACYAYEATRTEHQRSLDDGFAPPMWPWAERWWKPTDRRRDLVKAAALIIAEIERLDRAAKG